METKETSGSSSIEQLQIEQILSLQGWDMKELEEIDGYSEEVESTGFGYYSFVEFILEKNQMDHDISEILISEEGGDFQNKLHVLIKYYSQIQNQTTQVARGVNDIVTGHD